MDVAEHAVSEAEGPTSGTRTAATSRASAQVALAMFEATNAVERRYTSFLEVRSAPAGTSAAAAAAVAAHAVLAAIFPDQQKTR
jgi:hypothetical protein